MNGDSKWERVPIVDLCETHVDCVNRTAPVVDGPTEFKMIRTTNVRNGFIDVENVRYVDEPTFHRWTRRLVPKAQDVILTREAPLGEVGMLRTNDQIFLGQRLYHFRPDPRKLDPYFLLYSLLDDDLQGQVSGFGSGSTVEHMRLGDIPELKINVPDIKEQRRIAGILSAYDDLIENNLRRIRILEEMAQSLYREWFVHFRYPGHESVPLVDSPLGPIPKGWEIIPINDLCALKSGYAFKSKDFDKEGEWPLVTIKNVQDRNFIPDCQNALVEVPPKVPDYCHLGDGDLLLSLTGNIGRVCIVYGGNYLLNQRVAKLVPKNKTSSGFVYCFFADEGTRTRLENIASGVAQQNLSPVQTGKTCLVLPPQGLLADFAAFANKALDQVVLLNRRNQILRQTRDLLLPKLLAPN